MKGVSDVSDWAKPSPELVQAFKPYSTCNISDALDKLQLKSGIIGILPLFPCERLVGTAVTMRVVAAGLTKPKHHMGAGALNAAGPGDVIVIDNAGRMDQNCWGEIMTFAAMQKGIAGVVIDGVSRDVDVIQELGFPVVARGVLPTTIRGRGMEESVNTIVQCGGAQVRPGDIVVADANGVCIVPQERAEEVLAVTKELYQSEQNIIEQLKRGIPFDQVDRSSGYDRWMDKPGASGGPSK